MATETCKTCGSVLTAENVLVGCKAVECHAEGCEFCMPDGICDEHDIEDVEPDDDIEADE